MLHVAVFDVAWQFLLLCHLAILNSQPAELPSGRYTFSISIMGGDAGEHEVYAYVKEGDTVLTMEAMKMQSNYKVNADCKLKEVLVNVGDNVRVEQALIKLEIKS